ncbi:amidase [Aquibium microcysteis]|uniref:amidase n=1 Tax=Aquibium microcysteis TaxID=675281 RepID=UPI00165D136E|nr:amidase [Aquibium microcysteis]
MNARVNRRGSAQERLAESLARIADPASEGARACVSVYERSARAEAVAADERNRLGLSLGPLDGVIVSIKDLFDVAGDITRAGSAVVQAEGKPAPRDAEVVRRLRAGGAIVVAKTNMSELAFSGVGTNPHLGTPGNPLDRSLVPGGSSSGAAVAVADGFCEVAIGTDTGGSVRIPAALCGLTGFKPSRAAVPTDGAFPLSETLDAIGPIARSVAECAAAYDVLSGTSRDIDALEPEGLRLGIVTGLPFRDIAPEVEAGFASAIAALSSAGMRIVSLDLPEIEEMRLLNARTGGLVAAEAYSVHQGRAARFADMDPNIAARIEKGAAVSAATYIELLRERRRLIASFERHWERFDVLAMPTVPITAPTIAEVADPARFADRNLLLLRNTAIGNFFDWPAISLPISHAGTVCGISIMARPDADRRLLAVATGVEAALAGTGMLYKTGDWK